MTQSENVVPFRPDNRPHSVLVVDDEEGVRRLLTHLVSSLGYDVRDASGADAALELMQQAPADVVLCDIHMPGHDGVWLIEQLRVQYPKAAIVLATGRADMPPALTLGPGVVGYLIKPFQREDLANVLHNAVEPNSPWLATLRRPRVARSS